jgi:hypothetical protein
LPALAAAMRLRVDRGDTLYVIETPTGIELTPYNPDFAAHESAFTSRRDPGSHSPPGDAPRGRRPTGRLYIGTSPGPA